MKAAASAFFLAAAMWAQSPAFDYRPAGQILGDPAENSPDDPKLITGLVSAYLQKLRETADYRYLDRASQLVDRMLERDGGNFETLRFQNEIDLQRHDFRAVADRSRDMIRYNASDPGIWGNLGDSLMELGEYEDARDAYIKMFGLRPNLGSYNRLAYLRFVTGNADAAIDLMKQAIEAGSPTPENTAWCWAELGRHVLQDR